MNNPPVNFTNGNSKDNNFDGQMKRVFAAFQSHPKTMLMVSKETGILRANICRYVAIWKRSRRIYLVGQSLCKISKYRSGYYTTNPNLYFQPKNLV